MCVNLVVLCKLRKKLRCFPGIFTQRAQILRHRWSLRWQQISTVDWLSFQMNITYDISISEEIVVPGTVVFLAIIYFAVAASYYNN